jgi:hypothetical protein
MNNDLIFQIANSFVLLGWMPLIFAPNWKHTIFVSRSLVIVPLAVFYAVLVFSGISDFDPRDFSTLEGIKVLFANDTALVTGWIHYLAFDLFVGTYIVHKGIETQMPRWLFTLCLPFTFMFGPIGLLIFFIIQYARRKNI